MLSVLTSFDIFYSKIKRKFIYFNEKVLYNDTDYKLYKILLDLWFGGYLEPSTERNNFFYSVENSHTYWIFSLFILLSETEYLSIKVDSRAKKIGISLDKRCLFFYAKIL